MPGPRGNQPSSTGSNYNQMRSSKVYAPKKRKKLKYRKYRKSGLPAQKRVDNKQTAAINALSKKIYELELSKYGKVQQNFHKLERTLVPTNTKPLCFDLTDFTCVRNVITGGSVWQHNLNPPVNVSSASHWVRAENNNLYWNNNNDDQPDGGAYLAKMATYFVEIRGNVSLSNTRVRFDVISQKSDALIPNSQATDDANLPDTLQYMKHLADFGTPNRINPIYFKKYMTKTVYLNSSKLDRNTKGTTSNVMRFSFTIRPNKVCIQNETNPQVGGGAIVDDNDPSIIDQQDEIARGNFGPNNVPATQPLWCIISTDDSEDPDPLPPGQAAAKVEVRIHRRIVWADVLGSSAL